MVSQNKPLLPASSGDTSRGGDYQYGGYYAAHEEPPQAESDGLASFDFFAPGSNESSPSDLSQQSGRTAKRPFAATFPLGDVSLVDKPVSDTLPELPSLEEAHILPPKIIRDELILLYFRHIHPLCPFIDEYRFSEDYYSADSDEELLEKIDVCVFQAMMFAAFTHTTDEQIRRCNYESLPKGQKHLVSKTKALYRAHAVETPRDHIALIQVGILMSYWSPCDAESEVNRYWVDRALYHASAARIWEPESDSGAMSCRNRILWWCCLTRDRLSSLGLQDPTRLVESGSKIPLITVEDFGLESIFPRFMTAAAKNAMMSAFIWLCKLSDIMMSATLFLRSNPAEWQQRTRDLVMPVEEINKVRAIEAQLEEWRAAYGREFTPSVAQDLPPYCKIQLFSLQIINSGLCAALYRPYVKRHPSGDPLVENFRLAAIRRIKEASTGVALAIHGMLTETRIQDLPVLIVAWLFLPLCFYSMKRSTSQEPINVGEIDHFSEMHRFLSSISHRFGGARYCSQIMCEMGDHVAANVGEKTQSPPVKRQMSSSSQGNSGKMGGRTAPQEDLELEAEILDIAAKFVDLKVRANVVGRK